MILLHVVHTPTQTQLLCWLPLVAACIHFTGPVDMGLFWEFSKCGRMCVLRLLKCGKLNWSSMCTTTWSLWAYPVSDATHLTLSLTTELSNTLVFQDFTTLLALGIKQLAGFVAAFFEHVLCPRGWPRNPLERMWCLWDTYRSSDIRHKMAQISKMSRMVLEMEI